jgi:hypothetical protein
MSTRPLFGLSRPAFGGFATTGVKSLVLGVALLVGCAHEEELRPAREPSTDATFSMTPPPTQYEPPPARPRLSQTITLGEQNYEPVAPPATHAPNNGVNVTVNNNVVVNQPPVYGGYGYGYGYGGFGSRGASDGNRGVGAGVTPWRASGWEGAQRTAAPGQTPGVGGNWSPPPSYGPKAMR